LVRKLFEDDGGAHSNDLMSFFAMQAPAMSGQLAVLFRLPSPGLLIAFAVLPLELLPASPLDAASGVVVLWVGCSPLPLHLPLQTPHLLRVGDQFLTELREAGFCLAGEQRDAGGTQIGSDDLRANAVLGFVVRDACQHELHEVAKALPVSAFGLFAAGSALDQPRILDLVSQAMSDHGIMPVDEGFQFILLPDEIPSVPFLWGLEHKAQPRIVALVLNAGEPSATTAEAYAARLSQADLVKSPIGATGKRLRQHGIQMLCQPGGTKPFPASCRL